MDLVLNTSMYSLLIYMLLKKNWKESIFIIQYWKPLKSKNNIFYYKHTSLKTNFILFYLEKFKLIKFLIKNKIFCNKNIKVYGNRNIFSYLFIKRKKYILEHGLGEYFENDSSNYSILYDFIRPLVRLENLKLRISDSHKWADKIYLTSFTKVPQQIKSKVEVINLKELWSKKTENEKKEILDFFNFTENDYNMLKTKKYILFTQPLSEDNAITEEEKVELYKKIINNYDKDKLIIKTHPREKTDYKKVFSDIEVMKQTFPSELLNLLDIKFEKAITIFSTAAVTTRKDIKVDWYGTEVHPKILKEFGSMKKIMNTNAFLEK